MDEARIEEVRIEEVRINEAPIKVIYHRIDRGAVSKKNAPLPYQRLAIRLAIRGPSGRRSSTQAHYPIIC